MADVNVKPNDLEIYWTEPQSVTDQRVPSAQELQAGSHLHQRNLRAAQALERPAGLLERPQFTAAPSLGITLPTGLSPYAPGHPALSPLDSPVTVELPALGSSLSTISRYDYVALAVLGVVVTGEIDPDINLTFEWRNQTGIKQILSKENTRRLRTMWAVVVSEAAPTTAGELAAAMGGSLAVTKAASGAALSSTLQIYPLDPNLVDTQTYAVINDTIEVVDLCRAWRTQEYEQAGYHWGRGGEASPFEAEYHLQPTYRYVGEGFQDWESRGRQTLWKIFNGEPLPNSPMYDRVVQNLLNGQVGTNLDAPGEAIASPNGSVAIANNQRISFSNAATTQRYYCLPVITVDANGKAQASVPFQSSPMGSRFSADAATHRIYTADGRDVTRDGILTGLGSSGALTWTDNGNADVSIGDVVFFQPTITYPRGSGLAHTGEVEAIYLDAQPIAAANVREGYRNDLEAYEAPASAEDFIVVHGKERAALHYIYKKVTISSSAAGVLAIPISERGAIAFVEGIGGRIDRPVLTGLAASASYDVLIYYPPKSSESWQLQIKTSQYKGSSEKAWLDGATIAHRPITVGHTQGGGNGEFLSEGELQHEAISFHLPRNTLGAAVPPYRAGYRMQFEGDPEMGATSVREIELIPAPNLPLPRSGLELRVADGDEPQSKGMSAVLFADIEGPASVALGCSKRPLECGAVYQLVVAFVASKGGDRRLVVITLADGDPDSLSSLAFSTNAPNHAGMDTFRLY